MRQSPISDYSIDGASRLLEFRRTSVRAFTLVELMIAISIVGTIVALASVGYARLVDRARVAQAIGDIKAIGHDVTDYQMSRGTYPNTLAEAGIATTDPWGNAYGYLVLDGAKNIGSARKDKNLVPINTDFDLYSVGKNGATLAPLTAPQSRDDIVRANNGGFVGVATSY